MGALAVSQVPQPSTESDDAALRSPFVRAGEHVAFLGTALLVWRVILGHRTAVASYGVSVLLVFGTAFQSVYLALLLTFANEPWYQAYADTTSAWGLTPLADQQLAGAIMWVPAGIVHATIAMVLLGAWLRSVDGRSPPPREVGASVAPRSEGTTYQ